MSGRWVWVPEGWQVIPRTWFAETLFRFEECSINQADIDNALAAAPEPPSGWSKDTPPQGEPILAQRFSTGDFEVIVAYTSQPKVQYWWTPLPLLQEVKT